LGLKSHRVRSNLGFYSSSFFDGDRQRATTCTEPQPHASARSRFVQLLFSVSISQTLDFDLAIHSHVSLITYLILVLDLDLITILSKLFGCPENDKNKKLTKFREMIFLSISFSKVILCEQN
jgi:hypothetical protein